MRKLFAVLLLATGLFWASRHFLSETPLADAAIDARAGASVSTDVSPRPIGSESPSTSAAAPNPVAASEVPAAAPVGSIVPTNATTGDGQPISSGSGSTRGPTITGADTSGDVALPEASLDTPLPKKSKVNRRKPKRDAKAAPPRKTVHKGDYLMPQPLR